MKTTPSALRQDGSRRHGPTFAVLGEQLVGDDGGVIGADDFADRRDDPAAGPVPADEHGEVDGVGGQGNSALSA